MFWFMIEYNYVPLKQTFSPCVHGLFHSVVYGIWWAVDTRILACHRHWKFITYDLFWIELGWRKHLIYVTLCNLHLFFHIWLRWSANVNDGALESLGYKEGYRVDVDIPEVTWANALSFHDILIFNTGHWYALVPFCL